MNINKLLTSSLIAAVAAASAKAAPCPPGGFYGVIGIAASFNKADIKIKGDELKSKLTKVGAALIAKLTEAKTNETTVWTKEMEDKIQSIIDAVGGVIANAVSTQFELATAETVYPAVGGHPAGSMAAVVNVANAANAQHKYAKLLKLLVEGD
ncbi:MAG: hypothetical protein LBE97_00485, partial [Holosporales bacterium]|nr:hypothetical protein [Holosporales bacterium]